MVKYLPPIDDAKWYDSELRVKEVIDALDDTWYCFHHIRYLKPKREDWGKRFGEIDFLLGHAEYGFFGVEAKGGRYEWDQSSLRKIGGEKIEPDPITQAQRARSFFLDCAQSREKVGFIPWDVFAAFPDMEPRRPFGPTGFEEAIVWRSHLDDESRFLERILRDRRTWKGLPANRLRAFHAVQRLIMRERQVPPLGRQVRETEEDIEIATQGMLQLNHEQMEVVREELGHLKTVTNGKAGTGKTTLAQHRAMQLAIAGYRVLFFTPNVYLSTQIRELFRQEGLLFEKSESGGDVIGSIKVMSLDAVGRTPDDIQTASDELAASLLEEDPAFDALIIDEYQDLTTTLFEALELLLDREDGEHQIHVFGDRAQAFRLSDAWSPGNEFNIMSLTRQCRCAEPIQRFVDGVSQSTHRPNGIFGAPVEWNTLVNGPEQVVSRLLAYRDRQGLKLSEITPIVCAPSSPIRELQLSNEISTIAAKERIAGTMVAPKVADQFKGCESSAVVLLVESDDLNDELRRYLYMTMSRARAHLTVIAPQSVIDALGSM